MYEMKPEYNTGLGFIDKEHAKLFEIAEETHLLLHNDLLQDKTNEIIRLVSELIDYTRKHFAHEEEFQKIIKYPNREE
ncbi:MAG: hemerythrin, partial [Lachnospiraceae bacterium]|nr:hemerythrin [Lachnospiraceae bacterium]